MACPVDGPVLPSPVPPHMTGKFCALGRCCPLPAQLLGPSDLPAQLLPSGHPWPWCSDPLNKDRVSQRGPRLRLTNRNLPFEGTEPVTIPLLPCWGHILTCCHHQGTPRVAAVTLSTVWKEINRDMTEKEADQASRAHPA